MSCRPACRARPSRARRASHGGTAAWDFWSGLHFVADAKQRSLCPHREEQPKSASRRLRTDPCFETAASPPSRHAGGRDGAICCRSLVVLALEVALDRRRSQQLLDPFRFVKAVIDAEADLGSELQVNSPRQLAAQEAFVAL